MSADDESFHPLGKGWENELESMLDDTEYDTDLGMEMAQDAMRVSKGELSEAEFHEKYHEDVMDEFGVDDRPTEEAFEAAEEETDGSVSRMLSAFDGDGEEGRRDVMKKMGVGAAAVGLGAWGTVDDGPEANVAAAQEDDDGGDDDLQWGMAIDLETCDGCLTCVQACAEENNLDQGVNWMYVLEYDDPGKPETSATNRLVRPCQHCTDAPCEKVCPTTARHTRDSDGLVLTDYDVCIGCRYCQVACPYGVNYFQWEEPDVSTNDIAAEHDAEPGEDGDHLTSEERWVDSRAPRGVMSKCTMCPTRQDGQMGDDEVGTTACEEACPPGAIQFGDMNDERSDSQRYANNPSRGRVLWNLNRTAENLAGSLEEDLEDADDDLESVLENTDLDEDDLRIMLALEITGEHMGELPEIGRSDLAETEQNVQEIIEILADHGLDLEQEVLIELGLADEPDEDEEFEGPDEDAAWSLFEELEGDPDSSFKLLEEYGTNPNVVYLGNEPGPNAEQREPTGTGQPYDSISYERADGSEVNLVDNRKDVVDEGTVDGGLF